MNVLAIAFLSVLLVVVLIQLLIFAKFARLWLKCRAAGVALSVLDLVGMQFRRVPPEVIVNALVEAARAGLTADATVTATDLQSHYLAGGNVDRVVTALVNARDSNFNVSWQQLQAVDLAGDDVVHFVRTANPSDMS